MDKSTDTSIFYTMGNTLISALITSFGVVLVQSPIRRITNHYLKERSLPTKKDLIVEASLLGTISRLYHGFNANMASSSVRSVYYATSKKNQNAPEEILEIEKNESAEKLDFNKEPSTHSLKQFGQVAALTAGDLVLTQTLDTKAQLIGLHKLNSDFKISKNPRSIPSLFRNGFAPKFLGGFVNFGSLCMVEESISKSLPIENDKARHFAAGALSGMCAGIMSYPISAYRDHILLSTEVKGSHIETPTHREMLKQFKKSLQDKGTKVFFEMALKDFAHQVPLRAFSLAMTFSMVAGINACVGLDPINQIEEFLEHRRPSP